MFPIFKSILFFDEITKYIEIYIVNIIWPSMQLLRLVWNISLRLPNLFKAV